MKNILTILKDMGIEVPKDKEADLDKAVAENYKTVADYDKQKEKLDAANETIKANDTAMKDLQTKLDEFKDVDVSALNQRIKDLETEKANIQKDYDTKIADRDFDDLVKESIASVNGRNAKAITALLDIPKLKASKNQKEDIVAALKVLTEAEDSKMLFGEPDPNPAGTVNLIGQVKGGSGVSTEEAAMRAAMGLPPVAEKK
ncbi:MAG: phage scaffolding protein [Lachnospiraceae bacterium]